MESELEQILGNFLSPPVPFFFLGLMAVLAKSDLEVPPQISKFISLYLLMSIGFKGGVELHHSGLSTQVLLVMGFAMLMAFLTPLYSYLILKRKLDVPNAAALAAAFGSVSAVTFITAGNILDAAHVSYGGQMVAAMALMESPAIIVGVWLYRKYYSAKTASPAVASEANSGEHSHGTAELLREAFLNGSIVVLLGSLVIGLLSYDKGMKIMKPFTGDIFKGMLSFFLLDMGALAGKRLSGIKQVGGFLVAFGVLMPMFNAGIGIILSRIIGLSIGDAFMFTVLCASASYIAVPAAMRTAVPEANPGIYVPVALAITFPFNIIIGLPMYYSILHHMDF